ncbi:hypothetical protein A9Q99_10645 [Gammaproteobacteria bacterium 45_16_T64]|nr:hypothetical protein A9Q99_10645 [Gammaproteobacteria bacterium 45_16_T64]
MPYQLLRIALLRCILLLMTCLFCNVSTGETITVSSGERYPLTQYLKVLEDPDHSLTFNQVLGARFAQFEKNVPKLGTRSSTWWIKITAKLPNSDKPWYIQLSYPHLKSIQFFSLDDQGAYHQQLSGYSTFSKDHQPNSEGFVFPLSHNQGNEQDIYFRIASDSPILTPLMIMDSDDLLSSERIRSYAHGGFYGVFAVMGLFNLFIFFTTRDKSYLFYVFYISSIFLFTLSSDGVLRKVTAFQDPANIRYGCNMIMAMWPIIFGALFCQQFLQTRLNQPVIHRVFWGIILLCAANILLILLIDSYAFHSSVTILTLLVTSTALSAGVIALRQRLSIARFFLIAWICLIIGSVIWLLTLQGVIAFNEYSALSAHTGAALETILLSMALGDRINQIRKEKDKIEAGAKKQLEESNRLLAGSNHFKDEFLSVISHELRTPMNGVYGATELLEFTDLDSEQKDHIKTIKRSSNDMLSMVEDILTFTQSEAGTLYQHDEPIELTSLVQKLSSDLTMRCTVRGITYKTTIDDCIPPFISSDESKLVIVLSHILDNAIKFTENGTVTFSIIPHPDETHYTRTFDVNNNTSTPSTSLRLRFIISDTGCGVPLEQQAYIFDSFRQADASLTRKQGGLGIGLALCKRIVDVLNGKLHFLSTPGTGTTVTVDLAVNIPKDQALDRSQLRAPVNIEAGKRVLVVEDNYVNKLVIAGILKKMNLAVHTCSNGKEAVDFARQNEVDLILMDCQMPVMDGYEASRAIRKLSGPMTQVPIIAVTANANPGDHLLCLEAGMNDYLKKPITHALLAEKMSRWF